MRAGQRWRYLAAAPLTASRALLLGRHDFRYAKMPMRADAMPLRKRINLLATGLNLVYRSTRPWGWPVHAHVELSSICNLRCPVCPTGTGRPARPRALMDVGLYERFMDEAGPRLLTASLWTWGEPLLHPDIAKAVRIARSHGVISMVSTNGQNLDDDRILADLIREPPSCLVVSLDGITDRTNSHFRVGARLAPALEGVRRLLEMKTAAAQDLPVLHMRYMVMKHNEHDMRYMVMKHNEHELPHVKGFARDHGFEMLSLRALATRGEDETEHRCRIPDDERYRAYEYDGARRLKRRDHVCQMAFTFPAVLVDGTVTACDHDLTCSHSYGRIGPDGSFADIWFGPRAAAVRHTIRDDPHAFRFCRACPYADRADRTGAVDFCDFRSAGLAAPIRT
jgi:MoaA/NifB/PqqE/SkfB family radical SAM enzyme